MIGQPWDPKGARELEFIRHRVPTGYVSGRVTQGRAPKTEGCYACEHGHGNHSVGCKEKKAAWLAAKQKEEEEAKVQQKPEEPQAASSSGGGDPTEGGAAQGEKRKAESEVEMA